jgi:uncharacterized Zn finger protein
MKKRIFLASMAVAVLLVSCNQPSETKTEAMAPVATEASVEAAPALDVTQLVSDLNALRSNIEAGLEQSEKVELPTTGLRAQIAQKWSMIHYYKMDGNLVRIKTYPHQGVSTRTEEFYFNNGELALVVIEDDGSGDRGKESGAIDKMYYFHQGELINEVRNEQEAEYSIRNSDGERLLQEAAEYVDLMP